MITVDGSIGEGGGQILRTSLSLSLITGKELQIENIRAKRKNPGLQRQHLTAVQAAASVGGAHVSGAIIGSKVLRFKPQTIEPGDYHFATGSAGSTTLVLQTILPPLIIANQTSRIHLEGGTHNPLAPPFDFLQKTYMPLISQMGPQIRMELVRYGFYPAGGGSIEVEVEPAALKPQNWMARGNVQGLSAKAVIAKLPLQIAERELNVLKRKMPIHCSEFEIVEITDSHGPGNMVMIEMESENVTEIFSAFGGRGIRAEQVAEQALAEYQRYAEADVFACPHLADQLLLPLAVAGGGSFTTLPLTGHSVTNIAIIKQFLHVNVETEELSANKILVRIAA
jgi:RNA 3'-terminal phosphate cyclase (ATP)